MKLVKRFWFVYKSPKVPEYPVYPEYTEEEPGWNIFPKEIKTMKLYYLKIMQYYK